MIKPGKVAGFAPTRGLDVTVPADNKPQLEAERILKLLPALGLRRGRLSPASTFARNEERAAAHGAGASQYRARPAQTADRPAHQRANPPALARPSMLCRNWPPG